MPTLRWTAADPPLPDTEAVVMASRLEVRSLTDVPRFLLRSLQAWKQVKGAPGALGASLAAEPLRRTFWTLSAWKDEQALHAYARAEPHRTIMKDLRPTMRRSVFTFWRAPAAGLSADWAQARHRLAEQERLDGAPGDTAAT
ncbi:DUF3291 domain-containing protein [Streptomyces pimonensis]|uniref:DUF3291 domain-containing protein n=1 Tax=Streptomyces pimonensis TaxID=2860288 RepID=A0ABV4IXR4_9ACTN